MKQEDVELINFSPEKLEEKIDEKGMTQIKLNELSGFPNFNTVNKIIKKHRQASATELLRISKVLGVSPFDLSTEV